MSMMSRRTFLWITGGSSVALATAGERKLVNKLIPQVIPPEKIPPGEWVFFATTCRECPAGCGMHLWHRDGRVTKAEGNPLHPVNRGGLCPRGQSSLQGLYDPDRLQTVQQRVEPEAKEQRSWQEALDTISRKMTAGARVAVISSLQTGALSEVMQRFSTAFGAGKVLYYEPFNYEPLKTAHRHLFGLPLIPSYNLEKCSMVLSFAADFLETWISPVSFAAQFATMHSPGKGASGAPAVGRLVYVGARLSMTAANADEFVQVPPGYERLVAAALLKIVIERGWAKRELGHLIPALERYLAQVPVIPGVAQEKLVQLAQAFTSAQSSVALAGPVGSSSEIATETAAAAALLNYAAGRMGDSVDFSRPHALSATATEAELQSFLSPLGPQDILFVHDCNPLYSRPDLAPLLSRAGTVVYLGTMLDETAQAAQWVLPLDYPLESWGEYQPAPGVNGLMQPTMGRLYDTRLAGDLFLELARRADRPLARSTGGSPASDFPAWLRERWEGVSRAVAPEVGAEEFWTGALRDGGIWKESTPTGSVTLAAAAGDIFRPLSAPQTVKPQSGSVTAQLWLWSSIMHFDGRLANRGWLQEAPDPITFIVWGNWIDMHPRQAKALEIKDGAWAEISTSSGTVRAPVRITPEVAENTVALSFGQGHQALGRNARGVGANAFVLLDPRQRASIFGVCSIRKVEAAGEELSSTAPTREQFNREILKWVPLSKLNSMAPGEGDPLVLPLPEGYRPDRDLYPKREYKAHRWAMVIDLQRCIGCGACAVACYAENNIPVIGKPKIGKGREMAWLRVAPYRKPGSIMRYSWLPLLCQHCDAAPCEPVCPVFASMHNEEGLNAQIYNRCIGTRYCSNNCPYKVRRFNWVDSGWPKPLDLQLNPEVTVRARGVMEKCTFCVQRIRQAEYRAALENRKIRDGEIQTACMQSCPTRVYTFGDLLDPGSQVSRLTRSDPRRYHVLEELNTKPAVTFLRKIDIDL